ncbi:hypothetical protein [uncultured Aquimarina sp.]|nr:hypothetical protein [uncultured Aquimarina sp.]
MNKYIKNVTEKSVPNTTKLNNPKALLFTPTTVTKVMINESHY